MSQQRVTSDGTVASFLQAMRTPQTPMEAYGFAPEAFEAILSWNKIQAASIVSGLMTDVRFQVNAVRLDWLQRLILSNSNGLAKPSRASISKVLNKAFTDARVLRLEDPIEDLFSDVVPTAWGDRQIFTGHWEHAAQYTDTIIQSFERLNDHPLKRAALRSADAILQLSNALIERAGICRHAYFSREPWQAISLPSHERLEALARRVRFSNIELETLGIPRESLAPFMLQQDLFSQIHSELPGNSPLDFHPIIALKNGILVAHPGAISLAVRAVLMNTAKHGGVAEAFLQNLAIAQEAYSETSGFWPSRELHLSPPNPSGLRSSLCEFADGRFQHVIQVSVPLDEFPESAFGGVCQMPQSVRKAIADDVEEFWKFLTLKSGYRSAVTVLLLSGWGSGVAFELPFNDADAPTGWQFQHLTFSDAAQLGACESGKLKHLCRIARQVETMAQLGYSVSNINGVMNLFSHWRETNGQLIPEHLVDIDPPCNLVIPTDECFKPRLEAARNLDLRALPFLRGSFRRVQRIEWDSFGPQKQIYGSVDDAASKRLLGAVTYADQVWWIEITQISSEETSFSWQYQVWNAIMQWLSAVAPQILQDFSKRLPNAAAYVRVAIHGDSPDNFGDAEDHDPAIHLEVDEHSHSSTTIVIQRRWINTLRRPSNDGEIALVALLIKHLITTPHFQPSINEVLSSVRRGLPSPDWRWLHAYSVSTLLERLSASGLISHFREIPLSASALVKCGSVWRFHNRADGYEFSTEEQCQRFLKNYYDFLLGELIIHIKQFDRAKLVAASAARYQSARAEQRVWRTTIRALRSIHGIADADKTALEQQSAMNAVQRASKVICEIAACEAPETGGAQPSPDDLDELFARALLIFGNGQLWAGIRAGVVKPHLKISPAGDLLSDRSIFEKTFVPAASKLNTKTLDEAAEKYVRRNSPSFDDRPSDQLSLSIGLREALEAEFDCSAEAFVDLQHAIMQLTEDSCMNVLILRRSELHSALIQNEVYGESDPAKLLERLTLSRRPSWSTPMEGSQPRDLDLSRFDRRNSLINRPLLAISDGVDPMLMIEPAMVHDAITFILGNLHEGSLHNEFWSSSKARAYAGERADKLGREFEDAIAERLNKVGLSAWPRRSVSGILERATETDMGDVDVLAVSQDKTTVWIIEAKNLRLCRTESEVASRMSEYRGKIKSSSKSKAKPDKMLRHLNRVRYLRQNAASVGERLGLEQTPIVRGMMIVDAPQPMIFHMMEQDEDATCCMADDIESIFGSQHKV